MPTEQATDRVVRESAGYFPVSGADLYTVLHEVEEPVARVFLMGPFASERHFSYHPWVRWARYLAARRVEVLRFDYRGVGESTGTFQEAGFSEWSEDAELLLNWFSDRSANVPLLIHGLEIGGLLAGRLFSRSPANGLLLWSPPATANHALRANLMRWAGLEQLYESSENRRTASSYIQQLEQGSSIEVSGYTWTSALWRSSFDFTLPADMVNDPAARDTRRWPVKVVKLGRESAPLVKPYLGYDEVKSLTWLYDETFEWIAGAFGLPGRYR